MSRIGKKPIPIPENVEVSIATDEVQVKGPKGTLTVKKHPEIAVKQEDHQLIVERPSDQRKHRSLHGTTRMLLANAVQGVSTGYQKELEIRGVGFQAVVDQGQLRLQLGYSHDIIFVPPPEINITAQRTLITVSGIDKQLVGAVAAKIRSFRKPEPYKGKGIRYKDEYVRSKQGKTIGGGEK
jgi:large subunit ribosomal protein L6